MTPEPVNPHPVPQFPQVPGTLSIVPIGGMPEVSAGDELADLIVAAACAQRSPIANDDCLVVTQKIVSKAEGRIVALDPENTQARAELIAAESVRILRRRGEMVISETTHGFVCANAGVDVSNVPDGYAALLPIDPDRSARRIVDALGARHGVSVAVIVSDTFGRPWREGVVDVALGVCGLAGIVDLRGTIDGDGRVLEVTEVAIADEVAAAAELVMRKAARVPVAIVRGLDPAWRSRGTGRELIRHPRNDLFR